MVVGCTPACWAISVIEGSSRPGVRRAARVASMTAVRPRALLPPVLRTGWRAACTSMVAILSLVTLRYSCLIAIRLALAWSGRYTNENPTALMRDGERERCESGGGCSGTGG